MKRRTFLQAVSAFVAVATVAPETLAIKPIDWQKWNEFELHYADGEIRALIINAKDETLNREARQKLAEMIKVKKDGLFVGDVASGQGSTLKANNLSNEFVMGFSLMMQPSGLAGCAVDGQLVRNRYAISDYQRAISLQPSERRG